MQVLQRVRLSGSSISSPQILIQGSMELATGLADLQADAHCPVCKEYFKNPVTMECGHKVCLSCISVFRNDLKGSVTCPSCHLNCPGRNILSNQPPGKLTEVAILSPKRMSRREAGKLSFGEPQQISCPLRSLLPSHPSHCLAHGECHPLP